MRLPSRVLTINVANLAQSTSERNSPRRCPSSAIDRRRPSQELRACRAFARNGGRLSSESMAVFNSGQPPGTSPARRSRKFRTTCFRRSTVFEISPAPRSAHRMKFSKRGRRAICIQGRCEERCACKGLSIAPWSRAP